MKKILVVDDEICIGELIEATLDPEKHEVRLCSEGISAIGLLDRWQADLVIVDVFMPDMDGLEIISQIKSRFPHTRVIAMSGGGSIGFASVLKVAQTLGADQTLKKPFSIIQLEAVVAEVLSKGGPPL